MLQVIVISQAGVGYHNNDIPQSAYDIIVLCPTALITNRSEEILSILLLLLKINTLF